MSGIWRRGFRGSTRAFLSAAVSQVIKAKCCGKRPARSGGGERAGSILTDNRRKDRRCSAADKLWEERVMPPVNVAALGRVIDVVKGAPFVRLKFYLQAVVFFVRGRVRSRLFGAKNQKFSPLTDVTAFDTDFGQLRI